MKLCYFNGRGLAETSRLLFAINSEEYEDFRYPLEVIDFSKHEMVKEEFDKDKADGKLVHSLNKLPYLEVDGVIIPQSKTIERFLARRFNMMGETDVQGAQIDSICECVRDFKDLYQKVRSLPEDENIFSTLSGMIGDKRIEDLLIISIETDKTSFILSMLLFFKFQGS